ncbi:glycine cleavage system aminomethyltransferase GcvT [Sandaracinus amylolyticus]|uniref:Aminomethyltransferase n=1 Tax=Sandaracinus amylolyticus TaxID=927083 RepID=A0A0F6YJN3_9BACT|nr:glycine cleavage system aminomethyltransferase GcvT [Sandaracinus amylolyticus]AKF08007.1 Aminomethyltransferase [Sandaracinus amylolyticus]
MTDLRRTPLFDEHKALGARIVPFAGWSMPVQYAGLVKEHHAVRTAAGLFDVSHMGELLLEGPESEAVIDELVTADLTKLPDGKAVYCVACNEQGTILDDLIVYRRGREKFLVVCNASNRDKIAAHFAKHAQGRQTSFEDASDRFSLIALQGPKAIDVARAAGADDAITSLASFSLTDGKIAGVPVIAARTGYTAEDGFELFCANEHAATLWRALIEAGKPLGLEPAGLGARDTLRLEGRLSLYGNEIDETTNPLEAGLAWVVKLDKPRDFLGKAALQKIKAAGNDRRMVGFEMLGRGIARHGHAIVEWTGSETPGKTIGLVTSGSPAPTLDKNIGLGYVPAALAEIGSRIGIEVRPGRSIEAVVVKTPFYKRPR